MFAVQIAKALGADVTGVCSTAKVDLVRSLGADRVIDYTKEDFTRAPQRYDVILDMGGSRPLSAIRRLLTPRGTLVLVGAEGGGRLLGGASRWIHAMLLSPFVKQRLRPLASKPNQRDLETLKGFVETGQITPIVDRTFPLSAVPDAIRYLNGGRARGKVVITVPEATVQAVAPATAMGLAGSTA
jgi:NADPH:quinone reductase-like Zn-dependent oxidoreductase